MKAMIFSAGLGTRFKPWTDEHPKALALVNGKSLLHRNVEYLKSYGITDIIVNVHHFADQIIGAVNFHKGWGVNIIISDETDLVLETGGGLLKARQYFEPGEDFITINVDILCNLDLEQMIAWHRTKESLVTLAVTDRKSSRCFVFNENERLIGWRNLQTGEEKMKIRRVPDFNKAFSGISIFKYRFFDELELAGKFSLVDAWLSMAARHVISGYDHSGDRWVDVGRPESVAVAEELFW